MSSVFHALPFLSGGHRQTLAGHLARIHLQWHRPAEDLVVDVPDGARILLRVSWQTERRRPALVLLHGLEGCDASGYMVSTGEMAYRSGWHVVRMNLRGCGDGLHVCPRLYNAGLTTDLLAVLDRLASEVGPLAVCGFSLGANLALLTLARHRDAVSPAVAAVAAVCPPLDLAAAADWLTRRANRLYQTYFLRRLKASYRRRQRLLPELYAAHLEEGKRTIRDYDDAIVAPYGGWRGADHYYAQSSSGPLLRSLDRPSLILCSADDPMIPLESIVCWPLPPCASLQITATGGHVGFVGRTRAPRWFWAAERALDFLRANIAEHLA